MSGDLDAVLGVTDYEPDEASPNGQALLTPRDLGAAIAKPGKRPAVLENLIYAGKIHSLAGPPESGKTLLCLHLMLKTMALGRPVMLFDHETGYDQIADLLRDMDADPATVTKLLTYVPYPRITWRDHDVAHAHDFIDRAGPALVVFDSLGEMMAASGEDDNKRGDVIRFANRVFMRLRAKDIAVVYTDHDTKGFEGDLSRYAAGSGGKLGKVDVQAKVQPIRPFSRDSDGKIKLTVTKDRPGCLYRYWEVAVARNPLRIDFKKTAAPKATAGASMSPAKVGVLNALTDEPRDIKQVTDRFATDAGHGLKRQTMSTILNELADEGLADRIDQGRGREVLWCRYQLVPLSQGDGWPAGSEGEAAQH